MEGIHAAALIIVPFLCGIAAYILLFRHDLVFHGYNQYVLKRCNRTLHQAIVDHYFETGEKTLSRNHNVPHGLAGKVAMYSSGPYAIGPLDPPEQAIQNVMRTIESSFGPKPVKTKNVTVVDYMNFTARYFFSAHTDVEWNTCDNTGRYQVWYLHKNMNPRRTGNMFVIDNPILRNRYPDTAISLALVNGNTIQVHKNANSASHLQFITSCALDKSTLLHEEPLTTFFDHSDVYYLDVQPGEFVVFDWDVMHMSDPRGDKPRSSINFRVMDGKSCLTHGEINGYRNSKTEYYVDAGGRVSRA